MKKNFRKYLLAGAALLAVAGLSSCSKDDPDVTIDRGDAETVTSPAGRLFMSKSGVGTAACTIEYYEKTKTADVRINSTMSNGMSFTYTYTDVPYKTDKNGLREIDATVKEQGNQTSSKVEIYSGSVPSSILLTEEAVVFSAKADDTQSVVFIPNKSVCAGSTAVTSAAGTFTTKETSYIISFTSDTKADITVKNAKFAQNMPSVGDMVFSNLDVTYNEDGFVLTSASLIPTIAGVPYPTFAISDLRMEVDLEDLGDADFTFKCSAFGQVFTVKADDMYCLPTAQNR